jgi:biopolymer transport protein ExbD
MRPALVLAVLLCAAGCEDMKRDPPPIAEVEIAADGGFRLDGRPMNPDQLDRELSRRAADAPNEKLGRTRLQVRLRHAPGTPYERVLDMQERCQSLGISNVEVVR